MSRAMTGSGLAGLRTVALIAVLAGAVGAVGFLLRATSRNPSLLLVVFLVLWVLSPFGGLLLANVVSRRWSVLTRLTLYGVMLVVALGTLAIYVADAVWPREAQAAFFFIAVPPASWLFSAVVVSGAAFVSGRRAARADGV